MKETEQTRIPHPLPAQRPSCWRSGWPAAAGPPRPPHLPTPTGKEAELVAAINKIWKEKV